MVLVLLDLGEHLGFVGFPVYAWLRLILPVKYKDSDSRFESNKRLEKRLFHEPEVCRPWPDPVSLAGLPEYQRLLLLLRLRVVELLTYHIVVFIVLSSGLASFKGDLHDGRVRGLEADQVDEGLQGLHHDVLQVYVLREEVFPVSAERLLLGFLHKDTLFIIILIVIFGWFL